MKDKELCEALINGSDEAFEAVYENYCGYVATVARNFSRGALSEQDIDEVIMDVFLKLWNSRRNISIKIGLRAYLSAAARNAVKDRFKKLPPEYEDITELEISSDMLVEDRAEINEMMSCLSEALKRLSDQDREIFLRFYLYGESALQISRAAGISDDLVRTRLCRARKKLKGFMTERGFYHV